MKDVIEFNQVWKKFRKGEKFNSMRDAIPNYFKGLANPQKALELKDQEFWAVHDVSFCIERGSVVGIMGPNGAGKSTILKLLSRIYSPTKGDMKIRGRLSALIEVTAGFHQELTGRENVYLNGTILGMTRREIDRKFDEIVEFSGVAEFIDTPVKRFSSGMYSRLGFSVAAHMDPEILIVDEVLSVGDISFQAKCAQKMRDLMKSGATIVLVSHHLAMMQSLCERVILIDHGNLIKDGSAREIIPYYEDIVLRKREEDFHKNLTTSDFTVRLNTAPDVEITQAAIVDDNNLNKERFCFDDDLTVHFDYRTRTTIEKSVVRIELVRSDGVLCCYAQTGENENTALSESGSISINLGKLRLGPGIYVLKISVWDRELVHPYCIRNKDVLYIQGEEGRADTPAVMMPDVKWSVQEGQNVYSDLLTV
jgi:lipopolysaccharide transport system ATP-binding protein